MKVQRIAFAMLLASTGAAHGAPSACEEATVAEMQNTTCVLGDVVITFGKATLTATGLSGRQSLNDFLFTPVPTRNGSEIAGRITETSTGPLVSVFINWQDISFRTASDLATIGSIAAEATGRRDAPTGIVFTTFTAADSASPSNNVSADPGLEDQLCPGTVSRGTDTCTISFAERPLAATLPGQSWFLGTQVLDGSKVTVTQSAVYINQ